VINENVNNKKTGISEAIFNNNEYNDNNNILKINNNRVLINDKYNYDESNRINHLPNKIKRIIYKYLSKFKKYNGFAFTKIIELLRFKSGKYAKKAIN